MDEGQLVLDSLQQPPTPNSRPGVSGHLDNLNTTILGWGDCTLMKT